MEQNKQLVILQVLPELHSGGVERGTIEMAGAIARQGWKSLVASSGGGLLRKLTYAGGEHITLPLKSKNPLVMWLNIMRLKRIIKKYKVDIIHARSRAPAWSAYYAARATGCKFLTTFHGIYNARNKWKKKYNSIMTMGEKVIAISAFSARHIVENYGVDESRIVIIPRGVDLSMFNPSAVSTQRVIALAKKWRLPDDLPIILMPGRITRWKGHDVLIKALAELPHRNFFCAMVGSDEGHPNYRLELEKLITKLELGGNVKFVGMTDDMPAAYLLSHVVVIPSQEPEAFGRVAIEAGAMGRLVVATNHGGFTETVIPDETGFLVEPGSVEGLTGAILDALSLSADAIKEKADKAITYVSENYSTQKQCEKEINLLKKIGDII